MGLITGYLCLICLAVLLFLFVARKMKWRKMSVFFLKLHKAADWGFLITGIIHFILVLPVLDTRNNIITISGIIMIVAGILITASYYIMKDVKQRKKVHRLFALVIFILLLMHILFYVLDLTGYIRSIQAIQLEEVDLTQIENGEYIGDCNVGYIYAKVQVVVKDHEIQEVRLLEHKHERGIKAEAITDKMVEEQRIVVDAISGATNSSLVIRKACINALSGE